MVDDNDLHLSKFYFTVIQILRIAAEWIQESMDDLRRTVDDMERLYLLQTADRMATFLPAAATNRTRDAYIETFRHNWKVVIEEQERIGTVLLARIAARTLETESLRDGVSLPNISAFKATYQPVLTPLHAQLFNATAVSEATKSRQLTRYIFVFTVVTTFYLPLSFLTVCSFCILPVISTRR